MSEIINKSLFSRCFCFTDAAGAFLGAVFQELVDAVACVFFWAQMGPTELRLCTDGPLYGPAHIVRIWFWNGSATVLERFRTQICYRALLHVLNQLCFYIKQHIVRFRGL